MMQGAPDSPAEVRPGWTDFFDHTRMTDTTTERGEKRGVLSTGRATKLGKTTGDADANGRADDADDEDEREG